MGTISVQKRENICKHFAKKERRLGKIPGILYGKTINNFMFEIGEMELNKHIKENGEHGLIDINVDGSKVKALVKEIQRDTIKHNIIHIDLEKIESDELITTEVPINIKGEGFVQSRGGIIQKNKNSIKVQCKASDIPKEIDVDISNLKIGDSFKVSDVEFAEDFTFIEPGNTVVIAVTVNKNKFDDDDEETIDNVQLTIDN